MHNFLDLIEQHLLVVDSNVRWECAAIVTELNQIRERCKESEDYCTRGNPRPRDLNDVDMEEPSDVSYFPAKTPGSL